MEIPHLRWNFRVNFLPSNKSPFRPRLVTVVVAIPRVASHDRELSVLVEASLVVGILKKADSSRDSEKDRSAGRGSMWAEGTVQ